MKLLLQRFAGTELDTLGLLMIDKRFTAFTIEDAFHAQKIYGRTRIPAGVYKLTLVDSPHFTPILGHKMIMLNDVPNYQGVLIHPGNTDADTEGCLLVGNLSHYNPDGESRIDESKLAYGRIYPFIAQAIATEGATIEIIDGDRI